MCRYENNESPERVDSYTYTSPAAAEIVFAIGHQHVGAINISLFVDDVFVCASVPTYGQTPGKAGDEHGYLVAMSTCVDKDAGACLCVSLLREGGGGGWRLGC